MTESERANQVLLDTFVRKVMGEIARGMRMNTKERVQAYIRAWKFVEMVRCHDPTPEEIRALYLGALSEHGNMCFRSTFHYLVDLHRH